MKRLTKKEGIQNARRVTDCLIGLLCATALHAQTVNRDLDSVIRALNLKEAVVTAPKMRQAGDTISYYASTYISKKDNSLEDLLRKMPGMEIMPDGQVMYNGTWINEFYIEGADMLGGNYGVAVKNLDAQAIGSVQIMENHQEVKMLQGSKRGTATAMNIKLKASAKGVWSATLSAAAGSQPRFSWDAAATLMKFQRKMQNISVYKTNNTGGDLRKEIHAPAAHDASLGTGIIRPEKPSLSDEYAYRNRSHSLSINQLHKMSEDKTLTCNISYLHDRELQDALDITSYLSDNAERHIIRELNGSDIRQHFVGGHAVYKLNGAKTYLKNDLSVSVSFPEGNGRVNESIGQSLSGHTVSVKNALTANFKNKRGGISDARWDFSFDDRDGRLRLPEERFSQQVRQRTFRTEGAASLFARRVPHLMFNLNGEFALAWQDATTALESRTETGRGTQNTGQLSACLNPKLLLHLGQRFQWLVHIPAGVIRYHSREGDWRYGKTLFSARPYTNITYRPSDRISFDLTALGEESMPSALSLMAQKRYSNYRTSVSNPRHVETRLERSWRVALNASYKNVLEMLFGSITCTYARTRSGISMGYGFAGDVLDYVWLPAASERHIRQFDQTLSKGFFHWNSKISESFTAGRIESEYHVGDALHRGRRDYLQASLSYTARFARWLSLETSNEYMLSKPYTDDKDNGITDHTFTHASSLSLWPCKEVDIVPEVRYYYNDCFTTGRHTVFLDCRIEYYRGDATVFLKCGNLLDNDSFRRVTDDGITRYTSEYQLRGRTLLLGVRIKV